MCGHVQDTLRARLAALCWGGARGEEVPPQCDRHAGSMEAASAEDLGGRPARLVLPQHELSAGNGKIAEQASTTEEEVKALCLYQGWRQCPHCGHMVERTGGCNEITCICGGRFDYCTGKRWEPFQVHRF